MRFKVGDLVRFASRVQNSEEPMRVNRIDGEMIYVGSRFLRGDDGKPWREGNLILDSEWPPTVEAREAELAAENAVPQIEKGVPVPPGLRDGRHHPNRERKPSKWVAFLKSLEVGDSFLIEYPEANTLKHHARQLEIPLVWQRHGKGPGGMAQERIWRVDD